MKKWPKVHGPMHIMKKLPNVHRSMNSMICLGFSPGARLPMDVGIAGIAYSEKTHFYTCYFLHSDDIDVAENSESTTLTTASYEDMPMSYYTHLFLKGSAAEA